MQSALEVVDDLNALAYDGPCLQNDVLVKAIEEGVNNAAFRDLIYWLASELHVLRKTDEKISTDINDPCEFVMELSAMLKELGCPYEPLVTGAASQRYSNKRNCLLLLEYLTSELMAIKMCLRIRPHNEHNKYVITKTETHTARAMEQLEKDLHMGKPPANVAAKALFDKINFKVEECLRQIKPGVLSEPLLKVDKPLTDEQWKKLEAMHIDMDTEYNLRREMLLTRLEVTVQSFNWSERVQKQEQQIKERFKQNLEELETMRRSGNETDIVALLAARKDLAIIEKTSSANVRKNTACNIQKHVIGSVPDRGGRADEHAPPPPEMPAWQQRRATGGSAGNRGNRGNAGRGNWQAQPQRQQYQQQNKPRFDNQQRNNPNWLSGSGRVQGMGWSQNNNNNHNYTHNSGSSNTNNNYDNSYDNDNDNDHRRGGSFGGGYKRGRSNYNRGGRR